MSTKPESSPSDANKAQVALRRAVKSALERKRELGQYSVIWRNNQIIMQGKDAPLKHQES